MIDKIFFLLRVCLMTVPFILLALLNGKANLKTSIRHRQYFMPFAALIFCIACVADERLVFQNALLHFFLSCPVGNFITEAGPKSELLRNAGDFKETARNRAKGGMMVKDGCYAVFDAVDIGPIGAVSDVL